MISQVYPYFFRMFLGSFFTMLVTLALSFGPNVATYTLPATLYPRAIRSTFHGISAGSGKVGAVVGTLLFPAICDEDCTDGKPGHRAGMATVLWVQVAVALLGSIMSFALLRPVAKGGPSGPGSGAGSPDAIN